MKLLKFLAAAVIGVSLSMSVVSCGDDDPDEPQPTPQPTTYETLIIGKWESNYSDDDTVLEFLSGGTGYSYGGKEDDIDQFTWYITGDKLALILSPYETESYTIIKLDANTLITKDDEYGEVSAFTRL